MDSSQPPPPIIFIFHLCRSIYLYLIKGCDGMNRFEVHGVVLKVGFGSHVYVMTGLLDMYLGFGSVVDALKVFDEMPKRSLVTWNAMVMGLMAGAGVGICGRLVSGWLIRVIVFLIERNFLLRKRVLYFVYGLKKAVRNYIWLGLVLLTWHFLFDSRVRREANTEVLDCMTKILVCFLIGAVIWFIKTLIVKVLASSFHVKAFFDRIQESLFNQFVIETLSGSPSYEILHFREGDERTLAEVQVQMVVEEMNILTTVFLRFDNNKIVYPNSVLLTKPINNFYRSPDMGDAVEFQVHILTPPEKTTLMRQIILSYIENKKEHWHPTPLFVWKDIENLNLVRFTVWLQQRMDYQDMAERWLRRAQLVEECIKIFRSWILSTVYTSCNIFRFVPLRDAWTYLGGQRATSWIEPITG